MESPVRIKSGLATILTICLFIGATKAYPSNNSKLESTLSDNVTQKNEETTTITDRSEKDGSAFTLMPKETIVGNLSTITTSTVKPIQSRYSKNATPSTERSPSHYNKINARGTVKYFSTRPPFKPKIPMRRNITLLRTEASEKSSVIAPLSKEINSTVASKEILTTKSFREIMTPKPVKDILNSKHNRDSTTPKLERETVTYKLSKDIITPKPVKFILSKNRDIDPKLSKQISNQKINRGNFTSKIIKDSLTPKVSEKIVENTSSEDEDGSDVTEKNARSRDRSQDSKSLDADFNIDKYTSPEFHDINNVYSQAVSPDVEHYIVPENVADYYVTLDSGSYGDGQRRFFGVNVLTTPHTNIFDRRYKEVSDGIRENLADAEYFSDESTTEPADASKEVNFEELLARSPSNNSKISYKNTKELIVSDSQNALTNRRDYMDSNGTKIFYEMSMVSTENYDQKSSTMRSTLLPGNNYNSEQNEISTPSTMPTNKITKFSLLDNKSGKSEPNTTRRIEHVLRSNESRKSFLTTVRMRAHTTPRPRIRISLKNNRIEQNTTSPILATPETTSKSPEVVKLSPFRRRTTLTTASSKIDPVLQDSSPFKLVGHTKSDSENSIQTLRKRGSVKYQESPANATSEMNNLSPEYTIPPTATAWALITMKDTPVVKKQNATLTGSAIPLQMETSIKAEDELQKLDKSTEANLVASDEQSTSEKLSTTSTEISLGQKNNTEKGGEENKLTFNHVTSPSNNNYVTALFDNKNENSKKTNEIKKDTIDDLPDSSSFESITKFPSTVTTPAYEQDTADFTSEEEDYGTTGDDAVDISTISSKDSYSNGMFSIDDIHEDGTLHSSSDDDFFSNMDLTTFTNEPYAPKTIITSTDYQKESFTSSDTTTTEAMMTETPPHSSYKSMTTNYPVRSYTTDADDDDEEFSVISTSESSSATQETTTTAPDSVSVTTTNAYTTETLLEDINITTTVGKITTTTINDDITTTAVPESTSDAVITEINSQTNIPTTTVDDDISDFSFSTSYTTEKDITSTIMTDSNSPDVSNPVDITTTSTKTSTQDLEAVSTVYYGSRNGNSDYITSPTTTVMQTSPLIDATLKPTRDRMTTTEINDHIVMNSDEILDSREAKKTDDNDTNAPSDADDEDWIDSPDAKNTDSNEIPTLGTSDSEKSDTDFKDLSPDTASNDITDFKPMETDPTTSSASVSGSNIEIIRSESVPNAVESLPRQTTISYPEDLGGADNSEDSSGAIAAIAISVIGVIALMLLIGILVMARGRRRGGGYGQRCTPVSLDSYSLDNVSVGGSARRKARRASKRSYGNPAYDESGASSHPMQFAALANFALDQESIVSEFNEIPTITTRADEVPPGCESKNRYSNVIPLPETRVALKAIPGDETSEYINGNYVRGPKNMKNYYIACQAPLSSTVNDFWRMIWEQNSRVILMLTEYMENGAEKCYEYLPPSEISDNKRLFGDYQIIVKKREVRDKYVISSLQLRSLQTRLWREITHIWYFWPARGVPDECHSIIAFLIEARSYLKASQTAKDYEDDGQDSLVTQNGSVVTHQTHISMEAEDDSNDSSDVNIYNLQRAEEKHKNGAAKNGTTNNDSDSRNRGGPLVVHCSPGTGRTGALIACDIGIRDFEMSRTVDIPKTVYRIRRDRANAVQTKDQYIFIYKVLSEYATKLTGGVLDSI